MKPLAILPRSWSHVNLLLDPSIGWISARMSATLDRLSNGRVLLNVRESSVPTRATPAPAAVVRRILRGRASARGQARGRVPYLGRAARCRRSQDRGYARACGPTRSTSYRVGLRPDSPLAVAGEALISPYGAHRWPAPCLRRSAIARALALERAHHRSAFARADGCVASTVGNLRMVMEGLRLARGKGSRTGGQACCCAWSARAAPCTNRHVSELTP